MKKKDRPNKEGQVHSENSKQEIEEYKAKYLRALADYQNLQKRSADEAAGIRKYAEEAILFEVIEVLDNLEKLTDHIKNDGLDLIIKQFNDFLKKHQVQKIDCVNQKFDPEIMECIELLNGENDAVAEEVVPGYMLKDKVLRIAKVKVGTSEGINK